MPKGIGRPHLYLLLQFGAKPLELIHLGYNRHTVYAYSRRFKQMKIDYDRDLARLITMRSEGKK